MSSRPTRTESTNTAHAELDRYDTPELLAALIDDHALAVQAVKAATPELVRAVKATAERLARGGRLIYAGAGTSGASGLLAMPMVRQPNDRAADRAPSANGVVPEAAMANTTSSATGPSRCRS